MTSLARITSAPWSSVSEPNTPREIEGVRKGKIIGKQVKPVVGGRVLLRLEVSNTDF